MAEIKPMNLPGVSYDPMRGLPQQKTLAENLRQVAERKFIRQMNEYQLKKQAREEKDFNINKKAENFIFSNYPSSKAKGDFTTAFDNRKFGPGSREKELARWKEQVGGNYAAFQQWYDAGKKAEEQALYKSFTRNPAKYKSEKAYKTAISNWMNSMSDVEQQEILNNAPAEVLQIINDNWNVTNPTFIESLQKIPQNLTFGTGDDDDSAIPEALTIAGGLLAGGYGVLRGRAAMAKKGFSQAFDRTDANLRNITKDLVEKAKDLKKGQQLDMFDNAIPHSNVSKINSALDKIVSSGEMNKADADKFKSIVDKLMKSGKELTSENIGKAIKEGGDEFDSLAKSLSKSTRLSIGPVKTGSLWKGLGLVAGAGLATSSIAQSMGVNEEKADDMGTVAATTASLNPSMLNKIRKVIKDKGIGYVTKKIAAKGGLRLLGSVASKTVLSGTGYGALIAVPALAFDAVAIYNILADDYEE